MAVKHNIKPMAVRIVALLGKLAQSLLLQIIHNHTKRDFISFEDKRQGLMGVALLLHRVHTRPAVLSAKSLTDVLPQADKTPAFNVSLKTG